jgi:hypothetical protein
LVIYILYSDWGFSYTDWGFSVLFPQLLGKCQGKTRKDRSWPSLSHINCYLCCCMYCLCVNVYCHRVTNLVEVNKYIISFLLKLKMIMISKWFMMSCYTNLKARRKPSSTVFPHSIANTASCIRSMLDPNNVGSEHEESVVPRIPLDCKGWRSSGIKSMTWRRSSWQLCKNLVTSVWQKIVLRWWFSSLRSSLIANCNVLSLLRTETVCEKYYNNYTMEFKLLKTKRNLLYIRNQSVPRCKNIPPRL